MRLALARYTYQEEREGVNTMFTDFITEEEDYILTLRFRPMTLQDVANLTGYSRQRVRQVEAGAMRALAALGFDTEAVLDYYNPAMAANHRRATAQHG